MQLADNLIYNIYKLRFNTYSLVFLGLPIVLDDVTRLQVFVMTVSLNEFIIGVL